MDICKRNNECPPPPHGRHSCQTISPVYSTLYHESSTRHTWKQCYRYGTGTTTRDHPASQIQIATSCYRSGSFPNFLYIYYYGQSWNIKGDKANDDLLNLILNSKKKIQQLLMQLQTLKILIMNSGYGPEIRILYITGTMHKIYSTDWTMGGGGGRGRKEWTVLPQSMLKNRYYG